MSNTARTECTTTHARARIIRCVIWLLFGVYLCAAASASPDSGPGKPGLLNSERIQNTFGSYGVELLQSTPTRVSSLYSLEGDARITRTLAVVVFQQDIVAALEPPLTAILNGASLGATLKNSGWALSKRTRFIGDVPVGARFRALAGLPPEAPPQAAAHVYELSVQTTDLEYPVATVLEIHHPDYLQRADLQTLFKLLDSDEPLAESELQRLLAIAEGRR
ncbi:MAG: hypothetical protein AAGA91_03270 [Pseudomonadota bacterium]